MTRVDAAAVLALIGAVLGSSVLSAGITAFVSWKQGVRGDERAARADEAAARRDTIADRDALVDQLQEEQRDLRVRVTALEREHALDDAWNRQLVDHIYRQRPPPPPARPASL
ncbi:MAG: hypothetical protein NVV66_00155 [Cellulomonas sp.]|uniref:hypothetical protein n=1 Tax=Cellulomonas sp. TaxID=40001 RepID=UPI0025830D06|nr:hypothetical protein [Cellulomonas sp.]MCR6703166.1 hypothetical protein [Cellulomonas sp.]